MKPIQERLAEQHQDYESMRKFFLFATKKTKDKEKQMKYELSAKICDCMKEVCSLLFEVEKAMSSLQARHRNFPSP